VCVDTLNELSYSLINWSHDIYFSVHPGEGSSSVALQNGSSLFSPLKGFFYFLGVFVGSDVRSKVRDLCVQIVKPSDLNL